MQYFGVAQDIRMIRIFRNKIFTSIQWKEKINMFLLKNMVSLHYCVFTIFTQSPEQLYRRWESKRGSTDENSVTGSKQGERR